MDPISASLVMLLNVPAPPREEEQGIEFNFTAESSTPLPVGPVTDAWRLDLTGGHQVVRGPEAVVEGAARVLQSLALLPVDEADEAAVDALLRERRPATRRRKLTRRLQ